MIFDFFFLCTGRQAGRKRHRALGSNQRESDTYAMPQAHTAKKWLTHNTPQTTSSLMIFCSLANIHTRTTKYQSSWAGASNALNTTFILSQNFYYDCYLIFVYFIVATNNKTNNGNDATTKVVEKTEKTDVPMLMKS